VETVGNWWVTDEVEEAGCSPQLVAAGIGRAKLQQAYEKPTYEEAKAALERIHRELRVINESAARSLLEGLEETLTLHRLGLAKELGQSLKTTNVLESIMAQVDRRVGRVDRWRNSNQKHRWLATPLLDIEPRLNRIKGYRALARLRARFGQEVRNFALGGDLLGGLDSVHIPHPRIDLREQVRGVQAAEALFRHQEHLPDHRGGAV
jgi:hypothetical protein